MSFGRFIYFCAAWGAVAAFAGWALGRAIPAEGVLQAGVRGLCLGALLGVGLACVEAVGGGGGWHGAVRLLTRAGTALLVGACGGWVGGVFGDFLFARWPGFFVLGWTLTGLLIGAAPAASDLLGAWLRGLDAGGAWRKVRNGLIGGATGGLLGGGVALALQSSAPRLFPSRPVPELWTPTAAGFVALGACIGLAVGLAQVILKEAWLRVDAGFRSGRELILSRPETTIGRAESCDLGLFGDSGIGRVHARILRRGGAFVLVDGGSAGGTYVNDERISTAVRLNSGDQIRVGSSLVTFGERARRPAR
jgi:FHA domain